MWICTRQLRTWLVCQLLSNKPSAKFPAHRRQWPGQSHFVRFRCWSVSGCNTVRQLCGYWSVAWWCSAMCLQSILPCKAIWLSASPDVTESHWMLAFITWPMPWAVFSAPCYLAGFIKPIASKRACEYRVHFCCLRWPSARPWNDCSVRSVQHRNWTSCLMLRALFL